MNIGLLPGAVVNDAGETIALSVEHKVFPITPSPIRPKCPLPIVPRMNQSQQVWPRKQGLLRHRFESPSRQESGIFVITAVRTDVEAQFGAISFLNVVLVDAGVAPMRTFLSRMAFFTVVPRPTHGVPPRSRKMAALRPTHKVVAHHQVSCKQPLFDSATAPKTQW